jgi:hypothetical protein
MPQPGGPVVARGPGWLESLFGGTAATPARATARANPAWAPPRSDTR